MLVIDFVQATFTAIKRAQYSSQHYSSSRLLVRADLLWQAIWEVPLEKLRVMTFCNVRMTSGGVVNNLRFGWQ